MKSFFNPKTIAVIGASTNPNKVGGILMNKLKSFSGDVIPINPKLEYKTVLDFNKSIDLAIIAVPAKFVPNTLEQCGKKKIRSVIIISSGFSEVGNTKASKQIQAIAKKHKINFLGPNCFGITNSSNNLDTTFSKQTPKKGSISFISQSGALWSYIADLNFGFAKFISLGNPVGLGFTDVLDYLRRDRKTKSIILYIEKISNGKEFIKAAKKCKKPIYAIKAGKTSEGIKAAISHTGSLATDYEIYRGMFKQTNIILCETIEEALEKASKKKMKPRGGKKQGKFRIDFKKDAKIITNAGGAGALASDYLNERNIKTKMIDILGTATSYEYKKELNKHKKDNILIIVTPQSMTDIDEITRVIIDFKKQNKKLIVCLLGSKSMQPSISLLRKNKISVTNNLRPLKK
jgi:acetyltransferase